uniref:RNase H type-1 domain-containing protein n=1 Tax=Oryza barthii TaxID=65489 RepID=A0A0D3FMN0_9ORYZ
MDGWMWSSDFMDALGWLLVLAWRVRADEAAIGYTIKLALIETDSLEVVGMLTQIGVNRSIYGTMIQDLKNMLKTYFLGNEGPMGAAIGE